jgi:hypothetical protein
MDHHPNVLHRLHAPRCARERVRPWRFAADESADALHAWWAGPRDAREATYTAYTATLDREEQAALMVAQHSR